MKKLSRSKIRELAMIALYQIELYEKANLSYDLESILLSLTKTKDDYLVNIVLGVLENKEKLDTLINKHLKDWTLDRLGKTDEVILRISCFELKTTDTPPKVVINEAIELAKKYSDPKVVSMINGVLDKIYKNS
ncbi:MAG TPA: transcription antitermination factor NusB [Tenericutes bacterium]|nr:transcription antitermination factor NusB [Mycoplasmatota bacterium]